MITHRRLLGHVTLQSTPTKIEWSLLTVAFKIPSLYRLLIYWKGNTTGSLFHVLQVERLSIVISPKLEDPIINNLCYAASSNTIMVSNTHSFQRNTVFNS